MFFCPNTPADASSPSNLTINPGQILTTYVPGVNGFFHMSPLPGLAWARIVVCMVATYLVVELEKALIDPVMVPLMRPIIDWFDAKAPDWLRVDGLKRTAGKLCAAPRTKSMTARQRRGTHSHTAAAAPAPGAAGAAVPATGGAGANGAARV